MPTAVLDSEELVAAVTEPTRRQMLDLPVDEAGLKAWIERQKSGNPLEAAHEWAVGYRERHRKKRRGPSESTLWARILPQRKRLRKI